MRNLLLLLVSVFLISGCQSIGQSAAIKNNQKTQLLITIVEPDNTQLSMLNGFSRSYRPVGYPSVPSVMEVVRDIASDYQLHEVNGWRIDSLGIYCALLQMSETSNLEQLLTYLRNDPRIETAQPLHQYQTLSNAAQYNDPYFALQYRERAGSITALHNWATGKGVSIAIIDTGVDIYHPDIAERIAGTENFVDNDRDIFVKDVHGTAVSGVIAAQRNNGEGIVGIAPNAELWALKACWQPQQHNTKAVDHKFLISAPARCNSFTLANAISHAIDKRLDIINLSLAGPYDPLIERLVIKAIERNTIVVAADPGTGSNRYPALLSEVIAVGNQVNLRDAEVNNTSNTHHEIEFLSKVKNKNSVNVPGQDILSLGPGGRYDFFSGSSMSTAMVAGYLALFYEKTPKASAIERNNFIHDSVKNYYPESSEIP